MPPTPTDPMINPLPLTPVLNPHLKPAPLTLPLLCPPLYQLSFWAQRQTHINANYRAARKLRESGDPDSAANRHMGHSANIDSVHNFYLRMNNIRGAFCAYTLSSSI